MNTTQPQRIMQRWHVVQHELLPELKAEVGPLTPKLVLQEPGSVGLSLRSVLDPSPSAGASN
jgi:hypothetical protein